MRSSITAATAAVRITRAAVEYVALWSLISLPSAEILIDGNFRRSLGGMCSSGRFNFLSDPSTQSPV